MRKTLVALLALGLGLATAGPAGAVTITQLQSFSGSSFDAIGVTPFDPELGTLDRVVVSILGTLSVTGVTGSNIQPGPVPVPVGYDFQVLVDQQFFGLAGRYFEFLDPAQFRLLGHASGLGEGFSLDTLYTYDFSFTAATDLIGFTLPSVSTTNGLLFPPTSGIGGQRSDFVESLVPIDEIDLVQQAVVGFSPSLTPTVITSFGTGGTLQIAYDYTPAPVAVPAPPALTLLAAGVATAGVLVVVAGRRRRS